MEVRVLFLCFALIASGCGEGSTASRADRPNVLFIAVDDLRPEIGSYGAPVITPNLDRLAATGVRFDRAYAMAPACAASRASLVSGVYPHANGVVAMGPPLSEVSPELRIMPQLFKESGFETVEVGKFLHKHGDAPGAWSRERWMPPEMEFPFYAASENRDHTGRRYKRRQARRGPIAEVADVPDDTYVDGKLAARAVTELRLLKHQPFFLAVGFIRPHLPFNCPKRYWDLYDASGIEVPSTAGMRGLAKSEWHGNYEPLKYAGVDPRKAETLTRMIHGYRACVSYIDAQVGRLLDELERLELAERTVVVLWGDHGWHLGEHGIWGKSTALEPSLRIPLIVRVPGMIGGRNSEAFVETVDILPTLLELTGIELPQQVQGTSIVPLLEDPERDGKEAVFAWVERLGAVGQAVRTPRFRFVRWQVESGGTESFDELELYDHESDPIEYVNVVYDPDRSATVQRMNYLLDEWLASTKPPAQ